MITYTQVKELEETQSFYRILTIDEQQYLVDFYSQRWFLYFCPVLRFLVPLPVYPITNENFVHLKEPNKLLESYQKSAHSLSIGIAMLLFNSAFGVALGKWLTSTVSLSLTYFQELIGRTLLIILAVGAVYGLENYISHKNYREQTLKVQIFIKNHRQNRKYIWLFNQSFFINIKLFTFIILGQFAGSAGISCALLNNQFSAFLYFMGIFMSLGTIILIEGSYIENGDCIVCYKK